jgi:hypothetical protein
MNDEHTLLLGEIKGKLDLVISGQTDTNERLGDIDTRLRDVERKAATHGAVAGGVVSVGIALLAETLKKKIGL